MHILQLRLIFLCKILNKFLLHKDHTELLNFFFVKTRLSCLTPSTLHSYKVLTGKDTSKYQRNMYSYASSSTLYCNSLPKFFIVFRGSSKYIFSSFWVETFLMKLLCSKYMRALDARLQQIWSCPWYEIKKASNILKTLHGTNNTCTAWPFFLFHAFHGDNSCWLKCSHLKYCIYASTS